MTYSPATVLDATRQAQARDINAHVLSAVGCQGTGKSSLLNAIAGEYIFATGSGGGTTQTVQGEIRRWYTSTSPDYFHLIDTPGLADSVVDRNAIHEMTRYIRGLENGVSAFLLVLSINEIRLDAFTQHMLGLLQELLGRKFWKFVVLVFTHVDEEVYDEMSEHRAHIEDPQEGFVAELRRIYKLSSRSFDPQVIFTSTRNVRTSRHTQRYIEELRKAVLNCELQNDNKRFTCPLLREVLSLKNEQEKREFIKQSLREAWKSLAFTPCRLQ
ncbi:P-loop containing nucleoside triphosphate hydrolase protein [Radiomyces spectabilis]|uniref:P-loop containing nucleoside triphosphate hydrolase protein n=1 Tax=Radiomyces spectabilis TaxID=64574 RepID=UPI00221E4C21|nr:P-loop containing nucleoside triphosphate hydrolase protein [Radiomyces spectabilis]KAI8377714.1 P-loop containing nucleoside triphosphate hydrolase protein [Radiomyces spectabilis]